jgi:hypothetical protein
MNPKECPYCGVNISKKPKRKTKCIDCGAYIYVRKGNLLTRDEMILWDSLERIEYQSIPNFDKYTVDSLDKLWWVLEKLLNESEEKQDVETMITILLNMGIMAEMEGNYKNCIKNYLLCSHLWAKKKVERLRKIPNYLKFDDLIRSNYMFASPVKSSIKQLSMNKVNCDNLGRLAVTQQLSLSSKLEILEEVLEGQTNRLKEVCEDEKYSVI